MKRRFFGTGILIIPSLNCLARQNSFFTVDIDQGLKLFFSTPLEQDVSSAYIGGARIEADQKSTDTVLPAIAKLIDVDNDDFLLSLWWQQQNRLARVALLCVFMCRRAPRPAKDGSEEETGVPPFHLFSGRFRNPESGERDEEIKYVLENLIALAGKLANMTKSIKRLEVLHNAYAHVASQTAK